MQKRYFERIPADLDTIFFCFQKIGTGKALNFSENGMFIKTKFCFPFDTKFNILISVPLKEKELRMSAKVVRIIKNDNFYDGMGVELIKPPSNYVDFIKSLKYVNVLDPH
jgi:hypothetical protein